MTSDRAFYVYADRPALRVAGPIAPDDLSRAFERNGMPMADFLGMLEQISIRLYAERNERLVAFMNMGERQAEEERIARAPTEVGG